jgi:hypothetical protein
MLRYGAKDFIDLLTADDITETNYGDVDVPPSKR